MSKKEILLSSSNSIVNLMLSCRLFRKLKNSLALFLLSNMVKVSCMWTSIRNVKFFKNALEYNVYHRCLCNFLNQTTIGITVTFEAPYH